MTKVYINEWLTQFNKAEFAIRETNAEIIEEASQELFTRIKDRTPIGRPELWNYPAPKGYNPGTLRASWQIENLSTNTYKRIILFNDQPYAERVEYGWSTQTPPNGMMRTSLMEWSSIVDKIAKQKRR